MLIYSSNFKKLSLTNNFFYSETAKIYLVNFKFKNQHKLTFATKPKNKYFETILIIKLVSLFSFKTYLFKGIGGG